MKIIKEKLTVYNKHLLEYLFLVLPFVKGVIKHNPHVVWAKITLPTRDLKSIT